MLIWLTVNNVMRVTVIKPRNETLARFIQHFYLLKVEPNESHSYVTVPNTTTTVSFFKSANLRFSRDGCRVSCSKDGAASPTAIGVGILRRPLEVHYSGEIDEITIAFKPLGLNQFIESTQQELVGGIRRDFNPYRQQLTGFVRDLFSLDGSEARRMALRIAADYRVKAEALDNSGYPRFAGAVRDLREEL